MAKLIHTADLHLKAGEEKAYCFSVLDEIIALAEKAGFLVIAGDLFDSFRFRGFAQGSLPEAKTSVRRRCEIIYIPATTKCAAAPRPITAYNLDPVKFYATPFRLYGSGRSGIPCGAAAENYDAYRDWKVPAKKTGVTRVAVLHALNSTIFTGPDPEADAKTGVIDDDFFKRFSIDYAALGHVHAGRQQRLGGAIACYPGSPRVWRAHIREAGLKSVRVVETGGSDMTVRMAGLRSAGQYREFTLPLDLNGAPAEAAVKRLEIGSNKLDLVRVKLTGVVEDENVAKDAAGVLSGACGRGCARLMWS